MELGEKLRQARLQAGLSQRQLCGQEITRNMLSQIEHGVCMPSVPTLCYLARKLELPVSYFLEEETAVSTNSGCMEAAWAAFQAGDAAKAVELLNQYRGPDPVYDREYTILKALALLHLAELSLDAGRRVYAGKLLEEAGVLEQKLPWLTDVKRKRMLLQARLGDPVPISDLPCLDGEWMLYAAAALNGKDAVRAAAFLDACLAQDSAHWQLLRARAYFAQEQYAAAVKLLQEVEKTDPDPAIPLLEQCFSALGDYKSAYYYACKGRK